MSESTYDIVKKIEMSKAFIDDKLSVTEGEITDEIEMLLNQLEQSNVDAVEKISSLSYVSDKLAEIEGYVSGAMEYHNAQMATLKAHKASIENNYERIKFKVMELMNALGQKEIQIKHKKIKMLKSKSLVVEDIDRAMVSLPVEFMRYKPEVKKTELKAYIEETGVSFDGVVVVEKPYLKGL